MTKPIKSKYTFTLKNVDVSRVCTVYGLTLSHAQTIDTPITQQEPHADMDTNTTKLEDLEHRQPCLESLSFLDEGKHSHMCHVSMIDFSTKNIVPQEVDYHCFWCRHPFDTMPIGCPVRYVPPQAVKKRDSYANRIAYTIKEPITLKRIERCKEKIASSTDMSLQDTGYYETDGIFCSFNCCQTYINHHETDRLYDNSSMLLHRMRSAFFKHDTVEDDPIMPAPHWRLLKVYGGHLTIDKFRQSFNKIDYDYHGTVRCSMAPIGVISEEKIKF